MQETVSDVNTQTATTLSPDVYYPYELWWFRAIPARTVETSLAYVVMSRASQPTF